MFGTREFLSADHCKVLANDAYHTESNTRTFDYETFIKGIVWRRGHLLPS